MKFAIALFSLSVAVMIGLGYQALRQELVLREMKAHMVENSAEVKRKEESILQLKNKIKEMKSALVSVNAKIEELKREKKDSEASAQQLSKGLETCNSAKAADEKKKTDMGEATIKLKADHQVAKQGVETEITSLKKQILDRDKALCAFADTTKEEVRKLCGISEAPK